MPFQSVPRLEKCCFCIPIKTGCYLIVLYRILSNFNHTALSRMCPDLHDEMTIILVFINILNYIAAIVSIVAAVAFAVLGLFKPQQPLTADAFIGSVLGYDALKLIYGFFAFLRLTFYEKACPMFSSHEVDDDDVTQTSASAYLRYNEPTYELIKASESTWRAVAPGMPNYFALLVFLPSILFDIYFMMVVNTYAMDMPVPETESPADEGGNDT